MTEERDETSPEVPPEAPEITASESPKGKRAIRIASRLRYPGGPRACPSTRRFPWWRRFSSRRPKPVALDKLAEAAELPEGVVEEAVAALEAACVGHRPRRAARPRRGRRPARDATRVRLPRPPAPRPGREDEALDGRPGDSRDRRLPAAGHGPGDRGAPERQLVVVDPDAPRPEADHDRGAQGGRRDALPLQDDEGVPRPLRPQRASATCRSPRSSRRSTASRPRSPTRRRPSSSTSTRRPERWRKRPSPSAGVTRALAPDAEEPLRRRKPRWRPADEPGPASEAGTGGGTP